jgi:hypothetical protein
LILWPPAPSRQPQSVHGPTAGRPTNTQDLSHRGVPMPAVLHLICCRPIPEAPTSGASIPCSLLERGRPDIHRWIPGFLLARLQIRTEPHAEAQNLCQSDAGPFNMTNPETRDQRQRWEEIIIIAITFVVVPCSLHSLVAYQIDAGTNCRLMKYSLRLGPASCYLSWRNNRNPSRLHSTVTCNTSVTKQYSNSMVCSGGAEV